MTIQDNDALAQMDASQPPCRKAGSLNTVGRPRRGHNHRLRQAGHGLRQQFIGQAKSVFDGVNLG